MEGLVIREATLDDMGIVRALQVHLYFDKEKYNKESKEYSGLFEKGYHELLDNDLTTLQVAELDGKVIGCNILIKEICVSTQGRPFAIIDDMVVDEPYRNRGVGAALVKASIEKAKEWGCIGVIVSSKLERKRAHKFYKDMGFEECYKTFRIDI